MISIIPLADRTYRWDKDWSAHGHHDGSSAGWAHHGIVVTRDGRIVTISEERPEVLILGEDGAVVSSWIADGVEGHGLALTEGDDGEVLWISDIGTKNQPNAEGDYTAAPAGPVRGAVRAYTLHGEELFRIKAPGLPVYENGDFCPAQIAVDETRFGGSGDIWVADCYGQALVHRFRADGEYVQTLSGEEGAGRYGHPHSVFIDRRRNKPELLVADRRNRRVQVYSLDGEFLRSFGEDFFSTPGGFAQHENFLFVTELDSRIVVLDDQNRLVDAFGTVGERGPGWPNQLDDKGKPIRPYLEDGTFHTPHAIAFDGQGNMYVSEWFIGGRLTRLERMG